MTVDSTHNVMVGLRSRFCIRCSERHVQIDEDTSISFWGVFPPEQYVVVGNITMEDTNTVPAQALVS